VARYRVLELERRADPDGEWIPFAVRMKLDLVGLKMGLDDWQALAVADRDELLHAPVDTDGDLATFEITLRRLMAAAARPGPKPLSAQKRDAVSAWKEPHAIAGPAVSMLERLGRSAVWPELDRFGRYLVCSLATKDDEERLTAALDELLG